MGRVAKGCLITCVIIFVLPVALGLTLYVAGPRLIQRDIETPQLSPSQISLAETKINLAPVASQDTLVLNVTDLNALLQSGTTQDNSIRQSRVTLKDGNLAVEAAIKLPSNSADFPLLLRSFAGKEVGVYLELTPSSHNGDVYVSVSKASLGKIPLPVNTLISLLPQEWMGSVPYTEQGINLNQLTGPDFTVTDVKISNKDVQISYKTK